MNLKIKAAYFLLIFSLVAIFVNTAKASDTTTTDNLLIFRRGNGSGNVIVKSNNQTILNCGDNCTTNIINKTEAVFSATPNSGSTFIGWSVNKDNTNGQPQSTSANLTLTISTSTTIIYAKFNADKLPDNPAINLEDKNIPRVMFWSGKVNQHWDLDKGVWTTDSDGFSGVRENKLEYCQKFYPTTEKVVEYKTETTNTWKDAGNVNNYVSTKTSYRCVLKGETVSGEDMSNAVSRPNKGSVCYYYPELPLCLPLSDPESQRSAIATKIDNFVSNGIDSNTINLGEGERMAVIMSYEAAFNQLPTTESAYNDIVKIANGNWPSATSSSAESIAKKEFQKIYKREANLTNKNDNAAITIMAYGLRQKAENRNLSNEAAALKTFKSIYGRVPASTLDWNILQGISYSGATRELDSDGDMLSDRREKELGTDPKNKDTDGDGYFDGQEVANGYNPLKDENVK
jgi:hypothetical protein